MPWLDSQVKLFLEACVLPTNNVTVIAWRQMFIFEIGIGSELENAIAGNIASCDYGAFQHAGAVLCEASITPKSSVCVTASIESDIPTSNHCRANGTVSIHRRGAVNGYIPGCNDRYISKRSP